MKLENGFFTRDAVTVASELLGKTLVRNWEDGTQTRYTITVTEAYMGTEDKACHASKGRTPRTEIMYANGGYVYVYLIYGMYWMLNFVAGHVDSPQAVLICGLDKIKGSGRVGRELRIDKSFYGDNLAESDRIWIEGGDEVFKIKAEPRVGVAYAGEEWAGKLWRFNLDV